jgi:lactate dehydrogenase-like 2-hydroxyacid dehydrogenase
MNIVLLDGFTLNPGDLRWDALKALGYCEIHDCTPPDETRRRAANAEIILTNKTVLTRTHFEPLPKLKYIGVLATGTNVVDLAAARERGIPVTNVPAYSTPFVVQATFARAVRGHWGVENQLHWALDVGLNEDQSRVRSGHAAQNLAALRKLALNL